VILWTKGGDNPKVSEDQGEWQARKGLTNT
jgi:hypothetical protein